MGAFDPRHHHNFVYALFFVIAFPASASHIFSTTPSNQNDQHHEANQGSIHIFQHKSNSLNQHTVSKAVGSICGAPVTPFCPFLAAVPRNWPPNTCSRLWLLELILSHTCQNRSLSTMYSSDTYIISEVYTNICTRQQSTDHSGLCGVSPIPSMTRQVSAGEVTARALLSDV